MKDLAGLAIILLYLAIILLYRAINIALPVLVLVAVIKFIFA